MCLSSCEKDECNGCEYEGRCYTRQSIHPSDQCLKCRSKMWVPKGCCIEGKLYELHETNPANDCEWCNHFKNVEGWTPKPEGKPCGFLDYCDGQGNCIE